MFKFFKKNKKEKYIVEEVTEEVPLLTKDQIQLTNQEVLEIDSLISSLEIAHNEILENIEQVQDELPVISSDESIEGESAETMEFIREGLNNVMKNFVEMQTKKLKEKFMQLAERLNVWRNIRSKIDVHLRIEVGELTISDETLPISLLLAKVSKTINDNPDLLSNEQVNKIKDLVNSVMTEAFNS
jgi:translation elongation factor EF-Tu-like GTPase